MATLVKR